MKKSTKKVVSIVLAASMMFTSVAATPTFAATDVVTAYATSDYSFVPTGAIEANTVVYEDDYASVKASQALKYNTTAQPDQVEDRVYPNNVQTQDVNTSIALDGAEAKNFRIAFEVTAKADCTLTVDSKASAGKVNYIIDATDASNYTTLATLNNLDGSSSIYGVMSVDLTAGQTVYVAGQGTNPVIYAVDIAAPGSVDEPTTETSTEVATEAPTESSTEAPVESTTDAPVSAPYSYVPTKEVAEGETVYEDDSASIVASQALKYNTTAQPDQVGDRVYPNNVQTQDVNTSISLDGAEAKNFRVAFVITAKADCTIAVDSKATAGKVNYIIDATDASNYTTLATLNNLDGSSSIYGTMTVDLTAGQVVYVAGQGTNPVIYAIDVNDGSEVPTTPATETSTETTTAEVTETTTEATTYSADTILAQPVAPDAVAQNGHNAVDKQVGETFNVNIDLSNVENTSGINNYTFFVTYNPDVVKMKGIVEATQENIDSYVTYPITVAGMELAQTLYDVNKINQSIALTPAADEENFADYADVLTSDTSLTATCADLGKVKFSNYIGDSSSDGSLVVATKSGTLLTLSFEVVGTGDTEIAVDLTYPTIDGFKSNPTSGVAIKSAAIAGNIWIEDVIETTTEPTTDTTTETTTVEDTETTTTVATETTTEATTAESTETTTAEATETTTRRTSTGGGSSSGGRGGSSSDKASNQASDDDTEVTTDEVTEPTTRVSFTITNSNGQEITITPPVEGTYSVNFTDISHRPWAVSAIERLASAGIINGVSATSFAPDAYSKRADFVIMIVNTLGLTGTATSNFTDVYAGKYYYNAVGLGYEAGIVSGYGDGTFGPEKYCTREEMMVLVAQTFAFLGADISADESVLDKYGDEASISWWARPYVAYLTATGVATGTGTNIEPSVYITRAQMAVMVEKIYDYVLDLADEAAAQATTVEETTEETTEDVTSDEDTTEETTSDEDTTEETTVDEDATETTTEEEE